MDLNITVDLSDRVYDLIADVFGDIADNKTDKPKTAAPQASKPTAAKSEEKTKGPVLTLDLPRFTNPEAKRKWLVDQLTLAGVEIPPRTRTNTLLKRYLELVSEEEGGDDNGEEAPPAESMDDDNGDDFLEGDNEEGVGYPTKEEVNECLKAYVKKAKTEKDKAARRAKVKAEFKECDGANSISQLDESYYEHFMSKFGG